MGAQAVRPHQGLLQAGRQPQPAPAGEHDVETRVSRPELLEQAPCRVRLDPAGVLDRRDEAFIGCEAGEGGGSGGLVTGPVVDPPALDDRGGIVCANAQLDERLIIGTGAGQRHRPQKVFVRRHAPEHLGRGPGPTGQDHVSDKGPPPRAFVPLGGVHRRRVEVGDGELRPSEVDDRPGLCEDALAGTGHGAELTIEVGQTDLTQRCRRRAG